MSSYYTIQAIDEVLYKEKASKFIGFACRVQDEKSIKDQLEIVRKAHPKATHHCYAYRLGLTKNNYRINDDGEPAGTAGKPILGQIDSFGVTNCLVIVVRYFGGTKLGTSGLIDAYKTCAKLTLSSTEIIEQKILDQYSISCAYETINTVYKFIHNHKAAIVTQHLGNQSTFIIAVEQNKSASLEAQLTDAQIEFTFIEKK